MTDLPAIDALALAAQLRRGDEAAVTRAYQSVFGSDVGRFVLLHHLWACGVGRRSGNDASDAQLRYAAGMMDSAIMLANEAGYDEAALAAASVLTQELPDERNPPGDGFGTILDNAGLDADDL